MLGHFMSIIIHDRMSSLRKFDNPYRESNAVPFGHGYYRWVGASSHLLLIMEAAHYVIKITLDALSTITYYNAFMF